MSKTAEEILLHDSIWTAETYNAAIQAMHTYAQERAVEFHGWMEANTERQTDNVWYCHEDEQNHNSLNSLYQLFTQQTHK